MLDVDYLFTLFTLTKYLPMLLNLCSSFLQSTMDRCLMSSSLMYINLLISLTPNEGKSLTIVSTVLLSRWGRVPLMMSSITFHLDRQNDGAQQDRDKTFYRQAMGNSQQDCRHTHKQTESQGRQCTPRSNTGTD